MQLKWIDYKPKSSKTDIHLSNKEALNPQEIIEELDLAWFNFFIKDAPQGKLLTKNSYKLDLSKKVRLLHITPSLKEIMRSKNIFPSGGGLGSAIYCSPIHKNGEIHNLGNLYLSYQLPKKTKRKLHALCIEFTLPRGMDISKWGADYTLYGSIHCENWTSLKKNLPEGYIKKFEDSIISDIKLISEVINRFVEYDLADLSFAKFKTYYASLFHTLPELRFIIYETLAEYILLYQNNSIAQEFSIKGEIYNQFHKEFILALCPSMFKKFDMKNFFIEIDSAIKYLEKKDAITNFNKAHFEEFLKWRIAFYIKKIAINKLEEGVFQELIASHPFLIGQIIYRRFKDKSLFEEENAINFYKLWEKDKVICPVYSIVPKGEIGLNPTIDRFDIKYEVYSVDIQGNKITSYEQIDLKICEKMIDNSKVSVR